MAKLTVTIKPLEPMDGVHNVIDDFVKKMSFADATIIERRYKVLVNSKPRRMKQETWDKMLKKVLRVEVMNRRFLTWT